MTAKVTLHVREREGASFDTHIAAAFPTGVKAGDIFSAEALHAGRFIRIDFVALSRNGDVEAIDVWGTIAMPMICMSQ